MSMRKRGGKAGLFKGGCLHVEGRSPKGKGGEASDCLLHAAKCGLPLILPLGEACPCAVGLGRGNRLAQRLLKPSMDLASSPSWLYVHTLLVIELLGQLPCVCWAFGNSQEGRRRSKGCSFHCTSYRDLGARAEAEEQQMESLASLGMSHQHCGHASCLG